MDPMAKKEKPLLNYLVYLAIRIVVAALQAIPLEAGKSLARALAWLIYKVDKRHRQVAHENLALAFPELAEDFPARDRIVRKVLEHFCTLLIEIVHLPRIMNSRNWRKFLDLGDSPIIVDALLKNRPLMIVTGHFGNWEMAGFSLGLLGFTTHAIARTLDNPHLENFLRSFRERTGQKLLAKKGDFDQMTNILAAGGTIATLADQDAGPRGQFVDFFGRPASTHKAIALLAMEFNVPMAVVGVPRVGKPMKYQVICEDIIDPQEYEGRPDALHAITQRYTSALERMIRKYPEQYFWLHRRWKHQPPVKKSKQPQAA